MILKKPVSILSLLFLNLIFISSSTLSGQAPTDSVLLRSPYKTIETHLGNLQTDQFHPEIAAMSIWPSITDTSERETMAIQIKHVLDARSLYVEMSKVPRNPDYVDTISGNEIYVLFDEQMPDIYLEKLNGKWYYSEKTSKSIGSIYKAVFPFNLGRIVQNLPESTQKSFLGIKTWQYIGLILILGLSWLLYLAFNYLIDQIILGSRWYKRLQLSEDSKPILHQFVGFGIIVILLTIIEQLLPALLLDISVSRVLYGLFEVSRTIFITLCLFKGISLLNRYLKRVAEATESRLDDQLLPILTKILKVVVGTIAVIHILAISGVNVTALIAGVSIGGLALALAAQDTVKNLLGSAMIFFDKPFQIGDYIQSPEMEGTVEEVGFRSTRIRRVDSSLVSVPNGNLSNLTLVNLGARRMRIFEITAGFTYDSSPDAMKAFIQDVQLLLEQHEKIDQNQKFVNFRFMSASSLDIFIRAYLVVADFKEEMDTRQFLLFRIMELAAARGLSFAFPSTSVYIEQEPGSKDAK